MIPGQKLRVYQELSPTTDINKVGYFKCNTAFFSTKPLSIRSSFISLVTLIILTVVVYPLARARQLLIVLFNRSNEGIFSKPAQINSGTDLKKVPVS